MCQYVVDLEKKMASFLPHSCTPLIAVSVALLACSPTVLEDFDSDRGSLTTHGYTLNFDYCNDGVPTGAECGGSESYWPAEPDRPCTLDSDGRPVDRQFTLKPGAWCVGSGDLPDGERTLHGLQPLGGSPFLKDAIRKPFFGSPCSFTWHGDTETLGGTARCLGPTTSSTGVVTGGHAPYFQGFWVHAKAKKVLLRKVGHFEDIRPGTIRATLDYSVYPQPSPTGGQVIIALQTLDSMGFWTEVSRVSSSKAQNGEQFVSAALQPNTTFRLEIWTGEIGTAEVDVQLRTVSIFVPQCVPDASRPGECL